jgi:hypothetical protein
MLTTTTTLDIAEEVKRLEAVRRNHLNAIEAIDDTLRRIRQALDDVRQASPPSPGNSSAVPTPPPQQRSRKGRFNRTGHQSLLDFIRKTGNPSTAELSAHWRSEGRRGTVYVPILQLLKAGQIRRVQDHAVRGSRYALVDAPAPHAQSA